MDRRNRDTGDHVTLKAIWRDTRPCSGGCTSCAIWFTSPPFASASVGVTFNFQVTTAGAPGRIKKTGLLPKGVTFRSGGPGTGHPSGTPVSTRSRSAVGSWTLSLTARSGRGAAQTTATQTLVLTVTEPPAVFGIGRRAVGSPSVGSPVVQAVSRSWNAWR